VEKLQLDILSLTSNQPQTGSFALVLGERNGKRRLPIIIGFNEAQAIAMEIEKISVNRPMTHDLFKSFAMSFNFTIEEIVITDLKEGIFFARIICSNKDKTIEIDARPSDAIAIGVRFNVPIYAAESVMAEGGIEVNEDEEDTELDLPEHEVEKKVSPEKKSTSLKDMSIEKLNEILNKALEQEDYERAARIRDEINRRN
jgi:uncharacterized protein